MKRGIKILAVLATLAGMGVFSQAVLANCTPPDSSPYGVEQCGTEAWFQSRGAGGVPTTATISGVWWALGFGNANSTAAVAKSNGHGYFFYTDYVNPPIRRFYGVDSGGTDLTVPPVAYAANLKTTGGPADALCFGAGANWSGILIDGCIDANRKGGAAPHLPNYYVDDRSDNFINRYFPGTSVGTLVRHYQVDAPMGVLMKATDGGQVVKFALAFFASKSRGDNASDISPGIYDMGAISNGLPNGSGANNVVPWQNVPTPQISATFADPNNPGTSQRVLAMTWTPAQFIHDNSSRPCRQGAGTLVCPSSILGFKEDGTTAVDGVGVLDQGVLIRYQVESTPAPGGVCGTTWSAVGPPVFHPNASATRTVNPDTCVRLRSIFGKVPKSTLDPAGGNVQPAARGEFGDLGYDVVSRATVIGSALAADGVRIESVTAQRGDVMVRWSTLAELNTSGFEIVGVRRNGTQHVIARVDCSACSSGIGSNYERTLPAGDVRGAQSLFVRSLPSGLKSETVEIPMGRSR